MDEWISVKNRFPKDEVHVLLYDKDEGICVGYVRNNYWQHHPIGSYASDACLFHVTYWIPLPDPPRDIDQFDYSEKAIGEKLLQILKRNYMRLPEIPEDIK